MHMKNLFTLQVAEACTMRHFIQFVYSFQSVKFILSFIKSLKSTEHCIYDKKVNDFVSENTRTLVVNVHEYGAFHHVMINICLQTVHAPL